MLVVCSQSVDTHIFCLQILELEGQMKDMELKMKELEVKLAESETKLEESEKIKCDLKEEVDRLRASEVR